MMDEARYKIVLGADEMFMRYGIKSVTMDDLASNLSVSKKTIYQHFKDKDALVLEVAKKHMSQDELDVEEIVRKSENAIQELFYMTEFIRDVSTKMNPSVLFDLKKYHSKSWEAFQQHKVDCIYKNVVENLERGKSEGYYRPEIKSEILATMRMQEVEMGYDPMVYSPSHYNMTDVQMELFDHFIHGVVTEKGYSLYKKYVEDAKK